MDMRTDEIAERIYRLSVFVPQGADGAGFSFNHFLIGGDEPLLFHCGLRKMFPLVSQAVARVVALDRLRWLGFGHFEADECGSMNEWLAAAPRAQLVHGTVVYPLSTWPTARRACLPTAKSSTSAARASLHRHAPCAAWLGCGCGLRRGDGHAADDLFTRVGNPPPLTESDIVEPTMAAEDLFQYTSLGPSTAPSIRTLADLAPQALATMHGSSFRGDAASALRALADRYDARLRAALR